jgi:hypothetical protein
MMVQVLFCNPLTVEPRYYYNLKEILKERKPVTGNYLSPKITIGLVLNLADNYTKTVYLAIPTWESNDK